MGFFSDNFTFQPGLFHGEKKQEDELTKKRNEYLENKRNDYFKSIFDEEFNQSKDVFESMWDEEYSSTFNNDPFAGPSF